jgi:hypothetical protein
VRLHRPTQRVGAAPEYGQGINAIIARAGVEYQLALQLGQPREAPVFSPLTPVI